MKLLLAFAFLFPAALHAGLDWKQTLKNHMWAKGETSLITEFSYKNTGKTAVKIVEVKGGCACCTTAKASKKILAPGESGVIKVHMGFSGKTIPTTKAVMVKTDDEKIVNLLVAIQTPDGKPVAIPVVRFGK